MFVYILQSKMLNKKISRMTLFDCISQNKRSSDSIILDSELAFLFQVFSNKLPYRKFRVCACTVKTDMTPRHLVPMTLLKA